MDPSSAPIIEFLFHQFNLGKQYRTINTIRSAVSVTHEEVDGSNTPWCQGSLKGSTTLVSLHQGTVQLGMWMWYWPVYILSLRIANFHSPQGDNAHADRCSDLAALDLKHRTYHNKGV